MRLFNIDNNCWSEEELNILFHLFQSIHLDKYHFLWQYYKIEISIPGGVHQGGGCWVATATVDSTLTLGFNNYNLMYFKHKSKTGILQFYELYSFYLRKRYSLGKNIIYSAVLITDLFLLSSINWAHPRKCFRIIEMFLPLKLFWTQLIKLSLKWTKHLLILGHLVHTMDRVGQVQNYFNNLKPFSVIEERFFWWSDENTNSCNLSDYELVMT